MMLSDVTFSNVTLSVFTNFDPFNSNSSFVILCFSANLVSLIDLFQSIIVIPNANFK